MAPSLISNRRRRHDVDDGDEQQSRAELKLVEGRTLQEGDVGEARLSIVSGEIEKAEDEPVNFLVGKNWLPAGFNSKVMGMETGDVRVFDLDIPDDYYDEELRGKFASFTTELTVEILYFWAVTMIPQNMNVAQRKVDGTAMWSFLSHRVLNISYELAAGLREVSVQQNC